MAKVLTAEQADRLTTRAARKQVQIEARENEALEELARIGFRVTLHAYGQHVEADELLGVEEHYRPGECYAVMYGVSGRRKSLSGASAVGVLAQARTWADWQSRLKPDAAGRFIPSTDNAPTADAVVPRAAGDTAEVALRRASTERRLLSFDSGTARHVDAHGAEINA
jgi:hypothetical protein